MTCLLYLIVTSMRPIFAFSVLTLINAALYLIIIHVALTMIYPANFEKLPRTPEHEFIFAFAEDHEFPTDCIYQMNEMNAGHASDGLGGDLLIIGLPMLEKYSKRQMIATLGHEMGHRKLNHTLSRLFISVSEKALSNALSLFAVMPNPLIYQSFGFETEPVIGAFMISFIIKQIIDVLTRPLAMSLANYQEHQADAYSAELGYAEYLSTGLADAPPVISSKAYEIFHLTHPSGEHRIEHIETIKAIKEPKFYGCKE